MGSCKSKEEDPDIAQTQARRAARRRLSVSQSAPASPDAPDNIGAVTEQVPSIFKGKDAHGRKSSVCGALTRNQRGFENKAQNESSPMVSESFPSKGIGFACRKGLKPESPNQDDFFIHLLGETRLYGVFDGHGPYGHAVSNFVQTHLPRILLDHPEFETNPKRCLINSFAKVQELLKDEQKQQRINCELSGTTATVVIHRDTKLWIAHVGDSRCVLVKVNKEGKASHQDLTKDHKPNDEDEKRRIEKHGGSVYKVEGDIPFRVFLKNEHYPGLAMSRALGDFVGVRAGISPQPSVGEYETTKHDLLLLLCSDGVWEFIESDTAASMAMNLICEKNEIKVDKVQAVADYLAQESWDRWLKEEENVVDDITVQAIALTDCWFWRKHCDKSDEGPSHSEL